jgi:hypothetical protein
MDRKNDCKFSYKSLILEFKTEILYEFPHLRLERRGTFLQIL